MHGLREAQLAAVCGPRGHDRVVQVSRGHAPERRVEVRHLEPKQEQGAVLLLSPPDAELPKREPIL